MGSFQERRGLRAGSGKGVFGLKRLLVTGGSGLIGGSVCALAASDWRVTGTFHANKPSLAGVDWRQLDITDASSVGALVRGVKPEVIIHTAAVADIDVCERDPHVAWRTNVEGTRNLVAAAEKLSARLVHLSTSTVFDGERGNYRESDPTRPINVYARTKIASEAEALSGERNAVVRTTLVLGFPWTAGRSFLADAVAKLKSGMVLALPKNEIRNPIDTWTLASCLLELASSHHSGIFHIAGLESLSRFEMGLKVAERAGADRSLVVPLEKLPPGRAPRPLDASLNTEKARSMLKTTLPNCAEAIERAFRWGPGPTLP